MRRISNTNPSLSGEVLGIERAYFLTGTQANKKLHLGAGSSWTIGRSAENAFVFDDMAMSRCHAVVQRMQLGRFYFIDFGSSNGSTLNGRRITTPVELHNGDSLVCGETKLVFYNSRPESQAEKSVLGDEGTTVLQPKRLVTVLVVDIRDFTPLARQIDEGLLARSIGTWFRKLGSMFRRNGCATEKYIGDAAMAVWVHENQMPDQEQICLVLETLLEIQGLTAGLHDNSPSIPGAHRRRNQHGTEHCRQVAANKSLDTSTLSSQLLAAAKEMGWCINEPKTPPFHVIDELSATDKWPNVRSEFWVFCQQRPTRLCVKY